MEQKQEIWKDILKYEGIYQCSNFGNVRRLDSFLEHGNLKLNTARNSQYRYVTLYKNRLAVTHSTCSLIAFTFLDYEKYIGSFKINFKNGKKWDCRLDNLELISKLIQ